jgi:hypothetical protein
MEKEVKLFVEKDRVPLGLGFGDFMAATELAPWFYITVIHVEKETLLSRRLP